MVYIGKEAKIDTVVDSHRNEIYDGTRCPGYNYSDETKNDGPEMYGYQVTSHEPRYDAAYSDGVIYYQW